MSLDYVLVDVFAERPLGGNQLAVFFDSPALPDEQMQLIAREMNLSETTFVTSCDVDSYHSRIFTPAAELPFAGHPTLGTAWALKHLGRLKSSDVTQHTAAGRTPVEVDGDRASLSRPGSGGADIENFQMIAGLLGVEVGAIGSSGESFGRPEVRLLPSIADAGVAQLMVPLRRAEDVSALSAASVGNFEGADGTYCYAITGPGTIKARFFADSLGVGEDPATGSAAAALGHHLGDRLGDLELTIDQGGEIGRPSSIYVARKGGVVRVSGRVVLVGRGTLEPI